MRQSHRLPALALGMLCGIGLSVPVQADVITMPEQPAPAIADLPSPPRNGQTMDAVLARLGEPSRRQAPVGDPPITRWDYQGMIVVFEYDKVITTVIPAAPPTIYHKDELLRR